MNKKVLFLEKRFIEYQFDNIKEYIEDIESDFEERAARIAKENHSLQNVDNEEEIQNYIEQIEIEYAKYDSEYPSIFRQSVIIIIYSLLEKSLFSICEFYKKILGVEISYKNIEGKGIYKAINYLKLVCNTDIISGSSQWNNILCLNIIRNAIVHNDSFVKTNKNIVEYFRKNQNIMYITGKNYMVFRKGSLEMFYKVTRLFIIDVFKKIRNSD